MSSTMAVVELDGHYNSGPVVVATVDCDGDDCPYDTQMAMKFAKATACAIRERYVDKMEGNIQFSVLALMRNEQE